MVKENGYRPAISDHALLRYLERVMGVDVAHARRHASSPSNAASDSQVVRWLHVYDQLDVEGIRAAMLTPQLVDAIRAGAKAFVQGPRRYVIKSHVVVTVKVLELSRMRPKRRRGAARNMRYESMLEAAE